MTYLERVRGLIGRASPREPAEWPVDPVLIRLWCEAIGETNPIYRDAVAARAAGHDGPVAPPGMLVVWDMPGMRLARGSAFKDVRGELMDLLAEAGFGDGIVVEIEREFDRYVRHGEALQRSSEIEAVGDARETKLGLGHYVVWRTDMFDVDGVRVCALRTRVLTYRSAARTAA